MRGNAARRVKVQSCWFTEWINIWGGYKNWRLGLFFLLACLRAFAHILTSMWIFMYVSLRGGCTFSSWPLTFICVGACLCVACLCALPPPLFSRDTLQLVCHPNMLSSSGKIHSCLEGFWTWKGLVVTVSIVNTGAYTQGPGQHAGYVCYLVQVMSQGLLDLSRF